jgi:SRSO17 transposase
VAGRFGRVEPRRQARLYLMGLLAPVERKNGWQLAEAAGDATPDRMQRLLNSARWDARQVGDDLRRYVIERLAAAYLAATAAISPKAHPAWSLSPQPRSAVSWHT